MRVCDNTSPSVNFDPSDECCMPFDIAKDICEGADYCCSAKSEAGYKVNSQLTTLKPSCDIMQACSICGFFSADTWKGTAMMTMNVKET